MEKKKSLELSKANIIKYKIRFFFHKVRSKLLYTDPINGITRLLEILNLKQAQTGKEQRAVKDTSIRLYSLGLTEPELSNLRKMVMEQSNSRLQKLATRELALWHANQYNKVDAKLCLDMLMLDFSQKMDPDQLRHYAIMVAESQEILGNRKDARAALDKALEKGLHSDIFLAYANLETSLADKLIWINKVFELQGVSGVRMDDCDKLHFFDRLVPSFELLSEKKREKKEAKVSVIMPAYNAQEVIGTALRSLTYQTWANLEIIVVDDCSDDSTVYVVKRYAEQDKRIKLIENGKNSGPYVTRNMALKTASGEFVTCHDTDDWSHPEMIEKQVLQLMKNTTTVGNIAKKARADSNLKFYRRDRFGRISGNNYPSFMFRHEPVMEKLGYWDCVRFSADHELIRRARKEFGDSAVINLKSGPLCFQREHASSLTRDELFGVKGHYNGARKEYYEAQIYYHNNTGSLYYGFPQNVRFFPVPEPMWINREDKANGFREFDVIIASDFRLNGVLLDRNLRQLEKQSSKGYKIGLIQMYSYDVDPHLQVSWDIRKMIDGDRVQMLVYGEKVRCDTLIINHFPVLRHWQKYVPVVEADDLDVIIDEISEINGEDSSDSLRPYIKNLKKYFGKTGTWHPVDQVTRDVIVNNLENKVNSVTLGDEYISVQ